MIKFFDAPDVLAVINDLVNNFGFRHVPSGSVVCVRSRGSKSSRAITRRGALSRVMQRALGIPPKYVIEVVSERFDALGFLEKREVLSQVIRRIPRSFRSGLRSYKGVINFVDAPDIYASVRDVVSRLGFVHILLDKVFCVRSKGTKSRYTSARCWSLPRVWQTALNLAPTYIVEVVSEKFDKLSGVDKQKVLIHELLHIPKTFRGGLKPHKGCVTSSAVNQWYNKLVSGEGLSWE